MAVTALYAMASPPEMHRFLLESGAGAGPTLAAAAAMTKLSAEHAAAAAELTAVLGAVQPGAWNGPSAEKYEAAHSRYAVWLTETSVGYAQAAAAHESVAAAYEATLAATPTLPELAANHAIHGALVVTNFFGINTIPIALNELWYRLSWIRTAIAMESYGVASEAAVASAPPSAPAPMLLVPGLGEAAAAVPSFAAIMGWIISVLPEWITAILAAIYTVWLNAFLFLVPLVFAALTGLFPFLPPPFVAAIAAGISWVLALIFALSPLLLVLLAGAMAPALGLVPVAGAAIAVPISVPLGVDRHLYDVRMANENSQASPSAVAQLDASTVIPRPVPASSSTVVEVSATAPATVVTGGQDAGTMGFVGTASKEMGARPSGLTTVAGGEFGGGPWVPMLPATWNPHLA